MLQHQLGADIQYDLSESELALGRDLQPLLGSVEGREIRSFRDLFEHPHPPTELLDLIRQFAKICRTRSDGPLPAEIATVLYVAAIVAAIVTNNQRITKLDDQALCYSLEWALEQPWLDDSIRRLLQQGRQAVRCSDPESDV